MCEYKQVGKTTYPTPLTPWLLFTADTETQREYSCGHFMWLASKHWCGPTLNCPILNIGMGSPVVDG